MYDGHVRRSVSYMSDDVVTCLHGHHFKCCPGEEVAGQARPRPDRQEANNVVCYLQEDVQRPDLGFDLWHRNRDLRPVMDGQTLALTAPALSYQGRFGYV